MPQSSHGPTRGQPQSRGMDPSLLSALILLGPTIVLRLILIFVFDLAWVGLLLLSIVYLFVGYLAAVFYFQSKHVVYLRPNTDPARSKGVIAGMVLCLLSWIGFVLVVALSNQLAIVDGPSLILIGPIEFLESMGLSALGTKLKNRPRY